MAWIKKGPILVPSLAHEDTAVYQPIIRVEGARWRMWYTAGWHHGYGVCYAECNGDPTVAANWVKRPTPICPGIDFTFIAEANGRLHMLYAYDPTPNDLGANIYAAESFDNGETWDFAGGSPLVIPDGPQQLHQVGPVLVNDSSGPDRHLLYSSIASGGAWKMFVAHDYGLGFKRTRIPVDSLSRYPNGATGVTGNVVKIGSEFHAWPHGGPSGNLPSDIRHAKTSNPKLDDGWEFLYDGAIVIGRDGPEWDQAADAFMVENGGKSYMFYDRDNNDTGVAHICVAVHDGPLSTAP